MNIRIHSLLLVCFLLVTATGHAEFALRDGDTVTFLGDSITAARGYTKVVEHYTLLRFPDRRVRFVNAGQGGDTAWGSLKRLDSEVFASGTTVLTVVFGINDIGWGTKADDAHRQQYLDGIREIIQRSRAHHIRVFICSPAITAEAPETAEKGYLQHMTDDGMALARSLGAETIDLSRGMRDIQRRIVAANGSESDPKKHTRLHVEDGVHLNDLGQLAMAYVLLKGLGAPAEVSSAVVDAESGQVLSTHGCSIHGVTRTAGTLSFKRLDRGLPLNLGIFGALNFRWIPIPEGINRYDLTVKHLPAGDYELRAAGRLLGRYSADQLSNGINIASATSNGWEPGGPWDAQADAVKELVDARDRLWSADAFRRRFNGDNPEARRLDAQTREADRRLVALQRAAAKPYPYPFELRPASPSAR